MHRMGGVKQFVPMLPNIGLILHIWLCGEKYLQSFFFLSSRGHGQSVIVKTKGKHPE